ncbi:hypothetical protein BDQ12DRAFT_730110 [Crucibulum laeve]|uniref:Uncharacterized protein n=1 Tax=Crucibulum laeve TaxID=68775 RepID=A0A5C3LDU2_9AGAR|nr:hypothetical protein BDQ12DRAFT_730110 [Crucibulum laeve]
MSLAIIILPLILLKCRNNPSDESHNPLRVDPLIEILINTSPFAFCVLFLWSGTITIIMGWAFIYAQSTYPHEREQLKYIIAPFILADLHLALVKFYVMCREAVGLGVLRRSRPRSRDNHNGETERLLP